MFSIALVGPSWDMCTSPHQSPGPGDVFPLARLGHLINLGAKLGPSVGRSGFVKKHKVLLPEGMDAGWAEAAAAHTPSLALLCLCLRISALPCLVITSASPPPELGTPFGCATQTGSSACRHPGCLSPSLPSVPLSILGAARFPSPTQPGSQPRGVSSRPSHATGPLWAPCVLF